MRERKIEATKAKIEIPENWKDWCKCAHRKEVYYIGLDNGGVWEYWICLDCGFEKMQRIEE